MEQLHKILNNKFFCCENLHIFKSTLQRKKLIVGPDDIVVYKFFFSVIVVTGDHFLLVSTVFACRNQKKTKIGVFAFHHCSKAPTVYNKKLSH
jgi:hypothetical protein